MSEKKIQAVGAYFTTIGLDWPLYQREHHRLGMLKEDPLKYLWSGLKCKIQNKRGN